MEAIIAGENVALFGFAGSGKTLVIKQAKEILTRMGKNVVMLAFTGIAARNLGGMTVHHAFGIKWGVIDRNAKPILKLENNQIRCLMETTDVVIIDEISMMRADLFHHLIKITKLMKKPIQVIVSGDLAQCSPVISAEDKDEYLDKWPEIPHGFCFMTGAWHSLNFKTIFFEIVMRQDDKSEYALLMKELGQANVGVAEKLMKILPQNREIEGIYLYPRRDDASHKNKEIFDALPGEERCYIAEMYVENFEKMRVSRVLHLKKGCKVMTVTNDPDGRFVNGDIGYVEKLEKDCVWVRLEKGKSVCVEPVDFTRTISYKNPDTGKWEHQEEKMYRQIPLDLAFALTIHKAQGLTIEEGIILDPNCFSHGQLYSALTRVRDENKVCLLSPIQESSIMQYAEVKKFYEHIRDKH